MFIHTTQKRIQRLEHRIPQRHIMAKPLGLWYARDADWVEWQQDEGMWNNTRANYFYKLRLQYTSLNRPDTKRVLRLKTKCNWIDFTIRFGVLEDDYIMIDWKQVAKVFGGIECHRRSIRNILTPFEMYGSKYPKRLMDHFGLLHKRYSYNDDLPPIFWWSALDIDSGCVWNTEALKSFQEIDNPYVRSNSRRK